MLLAHAHAIHQARIKHTRSYATRAGVKFHLPGEMMSSLGLVTPSSDGRVQMSKPASGIFKNDEVGYLHRRLTERVIELLEDMRRQTLEFAMRTDQSGHHLWARTLPSVAYYNRLVQESMAADMVLAVPDIETAAHVAYRLYVRQNYGRDASGNINTVEFECPPFSEFFHTFFTYVTAHPFVVRQAVFGTAAVQMADIAQAAILDALRAVLKDRVRITGTITREERARQKAAARRAITSAGIDATIVSSQPTIPVDDADSISMLRNAKGESSVHRAAGIKSSSCKNDDDERAPATLPLSSLPSPADVTSNSANSRVAWMTSLQNNSHDSRASSAGTSKHTVHTTASSAHSRADENGSNFMMAPVSRLMPDDSVSRLSRAHEPVAAASQQLPSSKMMRTSSMSAMRPAAIRTAYTTSSSAINPKDHAADNGMSREEAHTPPAPPKPASVRILTYKKPAAAATSGSAGPSAQTRSRAFSDTSSSSSRSD